MLFWNYDFSWGGGLKWLNIQDCFRGGKLPNATGHKAIDNNVNVEFRCGCKGIAGPTGTCCSMRALGCLKV